MNLYVFKANMYKYFITLLRAYPRSFFISSILRIFSSLLFAYLLYEIVFQRQLSSEFLLYTGTNDYLSYIVVGVLVYTFTVSTLLNVSRSLITERRLGTLESVMLAPYNRGLYFVAYMLAQTLHTLMEMVIALPLLLLFKASFPSFHLVSMLVILVMTLFSFLGISLLLANFMLYTRDTYISQNTLFSLIFLLCGINFPHEYLPSILHPVAKLIPVTHCVELFRGVLLRGEVWTQHIDKLQILLIQGIVYCGIGFILLSHVEKIALEQIEG